MHARPLLSSYTIARTSATASIPRIFRSTRSLCSIRGLHAYSFRTSLSCRSGQPRVPPSYYSTRSTSSTYQDHVLPLSTSQKPTIFALASAPGRAGVAVIRVSGPDALKAYEMMVITSSGSSATAPEPWKMRRCQLVHPATKEELDDGLCVFFPGPRTFTGEDVLELHTHGGRAVPTAVLHALGTIPGLRLAEPGEFSRRAFNAGRMSLAQAEALVDLVDAETDAQRQAARRGVSGETTRVYEQMRSDIIRCLASVEALIDFGEGEDIEDGVFVDAQEHAKRVRELIGNHLNDGRRGELVRAGIRLAIFGPPNAGKSSLLNHLAQREAAIVTSIAGTTRDVLELTLDVGGLPVRVVDTAGLRDTPDVVERIGVARAKEAVAQADVALCVLAADALAEDAEAHVKDVVALVGESTLVLVNKTDAVPASSATDLPLPSCGPIFMGSVTTGVGMRTFVDGLAQVLKARFDYAAEGAHAPLITHARHRAHLERAAEFLDAFLVADGSDVVVAAEELRYAAKEIGKVTGAIGSEDVLDVVFGSFCIGK